jgi:DNA ligase-associated metallophosphoesterase
VLASQQFLLHNQNLWLSVDRSIYWENQKTLIVSDTHFGKTGHFRKSGIAVPQNVYKEDLQRLVSQLQYYKPVQLVIVGDLFHSVMNKELDFFKRWRSDLSQLHIQLVKGNHDVLKKDWYASNNITVSDSHLHIGNFCFVHDIKEACEPSPSIDYYFSGHIHPCITLNGTGKQSLKFSCYYFTKTFAVLPAFGKFTGTSAMEQKHADHVFAIIPSNPAKGEHGAVVKM